MKKGIVMEQHRGYIIVMTADGLFEKAYPIENISIGLEVEYEPMVQRDRLTIMKKEFFTLRVVALACVILIALLPFYMWTDNNSTYAYVNIDINPSIEVEINEDLEVISMLAFNDDAVLLIERLGDMKGKNIELVVDKIISTSEETGLVNADKNVLIGVHYLEENNKGTVLDVIDHHVESKRSEWDVITLEIPDDIRERAEESNVSMNKVLAHTVKEQSLEKDISITEEDKKVLQSFFNQHPKTKVEITTEDTSKEGKPNPSTDKREKAEPVKPEQHAHPSELKGKNGEKNSAKLQEKNQKEEKEQHKKSEKRMEKSNGNNHPEHSRKSEKGNHKENKNHWNQEEPTNKANEKSKPAGQKSNDQHNDKRNGKSNENKGSNHKPSNHDQHKKHDKERSRGNQDD